VKFANSQYESEVTDKINLPNIEKKNSKVDVGLNTLHRNRATPTKDMLRKTISQKGLNTTRSVNSLTDRKNIEGLKSLPRIHKGITLLPENNSRKVLDEKKWEEANRAYVKYKETVDVQQREIDLMKETMGEKDHIIKRLMEELKNDEVFLNKAI